MSQRKSGFTLIEILVVIAIIAILSSILFPVFARARENARRTSCQSNLKQIALGTLQYTQDYDERFPLPAYWDGASTPLQTDTNMPGWYYAQSDYNRIISWMDMTFPYIKNIQVYQCPSAKSRANSTAAVPANYSYNPYISNAVHNIYNGNYSANFKSPLRMSMIVNPAESMLHMDYQSKYGFYLRWNDYPGRATYNEVFIHFEGDNIAYVDGHVKWLKNTDPRLRSAAKPLWDPM